MFRNIVFPISKHKAVYFQLGFVENFILKHVFIYFETCLPESFILKHFVPYFETLENIELYFKT